MAPFSISIVNFLVYLCVVSYYSYFHVIVVDSHSYNNSYSDILILTFATYCISRSLVQQSEGVTLNILSRYQVSNCQGYSLLNEHYIVYICHILKLGTYLRGILPPRQPRPSSTHKNTILMAPAYINISAEIWNAVSQSILCITIIFHQKYLKQ